MIASSIPDSEPGKIRVLYLISSFSQGGAERHLLELIRSLNPTIYDTAICVLRNTIHYAGDLPSGEPRFPLGRTSFFDPRTVFGIRDAIARFRPHILHCYLNDGNLWGRLATRLLPQAKRPKVITSVHLDVMEWTYRWMERPLSSQCDVVIAHSKSISNYLVDRLRLDPGKVRIFLNGVDALRFLPIPSESKRATREKLSVPMGGHVALMAARIAPQKNHRLVMEALGQLKAAGKLPDTFRLWLAGRVSSAAYDRGMRADMKAYGLENHVTILGACQDMPTLYGSADSIWLPSRTEASPIAALEGSACGRPVLISDAANTDRVVLNGQTGWQVPANQSDALAAKIGELLSLDATALDSLGRAGRDHVERNFSNVQVSRRFAELYNELYLGGRRRDDHP